MEVDLCVHGFHGAVNGMHNSDNNAIKIPIAREKGILTCEIYVQTQFDFSPFSAFPLT